MLRRKSTSMVLMIITIFSVGVFASAYSSGFYERDDIAIKNNKPLINHKTQSITEAISVAEAKLLPHNTEVIINGVVASSNETYSYIVDSNTGVGVKIEDLGNLTYKQSVEVKGTINVIEPIKIVTIKGGEFIRQLAGNVPFFPKELKFTDNITSNDIGNFVSISKCSYTNYQGSVYSFTKYEKESQQDIGFNVHLMDSDALKDEMTYLRKFSDGYSKIAIDKIIGVVGYNNSDYEFEIHQGCSVTIDYIDATIQAMNMSHKTEDGHCKTQFYIAREYVLGMPNDSLHSFKTSSLPDIRAARERYLEWARILHEEPYADISKSHKILRQYDYSGIIIIGVAISVVFISMYGLLIITKKRNIN